MCVIKVYIHVSGWRPRWATAGVTLRSPKQNKVNFKYGSAAQRSFTDCFLLYNSGPRPAGAQTQPCPGLLKAHMSSWSHTSAPAVNLCLKGRQIIIHMLGCLFFFFFLPLFFSLLPLSHIPTPDNEVEGSHGEELLKNPLSLESVQTVAQSLSSSSAHSSEPLGQMPLISVRHQTRSCFHPERCRGSEMWSFWLRRAVLQAPRRPWARQVNLQLFTSAAQLQTAVMRSYTS